MTVRGFLACGRVDGWMRVSVTVCLSIYLFDESVVPQMSSSEVAPLQFVGRHERVVDPCSTGVLVEVVAWVHCRVHLGQHRCTDGDAVRTLTYLTVQNHTTHTFNTLYRADLSTAKTINNTFYQKKLFLNCISFLNPWRFLFVMMTLLVPVHDII